MTQPQSQDQALMEVASLQGICITGAAAQCTTCLFLLFQSRVGTCTQTVATKDTDPQHPAPQQEKDPTPTHREGLSQRVAGAGGSAKRGCGGR